MERLKSTISKIEKVNEEIKEITQKRLDNLTKPQGSLGRLEELAKQICAIKGSVNFKLDNKVIFTIAGDHGVASEGVSAYPSEVTPQMVHNFISGGAGINVLSRHVGARVVVVDMGINGEITNYKVQSKKNEEINNFKEKKINFGTKNFTKEPAMTKDEAVKSIEAGIDLVEEEMANGIDIVGTGDMGIGNTTPSSAIVAAITGESVEFVTGRGTGIDDKALKNKIDVINRALELNKPNKQDPIDVLSKVGGYEIGGICGVILGCAANKIPVVVDGFISGAGALLAYKLESKVKDYMIAAHCSLERGHKVILKHIGIEPLLDFNLRLGEGTGAALGISIVEAAYKILTEMATFESAGVSEKK